MNQKKLAICLIAFEAASILLTGCAGPGVSGESSSSPSQGQSSEIISFEIASSEEQEKDPSLPNLKKHPGSYTAIAYEVPPAGDRKLFGKWELVLDANGNIVMDSSPQMCGKPLQIIYLTDYDDKGNVVRSECREYERPDPDDPTKLGDLFSKNVWNKENKTETPTTEEPESTQKSGTITGDNTEQEPFDRIKYEYAENGILIYREGFHGNQSILINEYDPVSHVLKEYAVVDSWWTKPEKERKTLMEETYFTLDGKKERCIDYEYGGVVFIGMWDYGWQVNVTDDPKKKREYRYYSEGDPIDHDYIEYDSNGVIAKKQSVDPQGRTLTETLYTDGEMTRKIETSYDAEDPDLPGKNVEIHIEYFMDPEGKWQPVEEIRTVPCHHDILTEYGSYSNKDSSMLYTVDHFRKTSGYISLIYYRAAYDGTGFGESTADISFYPDGTLKHYYYQNPSGEYCTGEYDEHGNIIEMERPNEGKILHLEWEYTYE